MSDERRALLESIAFGGDASVKPGERLRALELLDAAGEEGVCWCKDIRYLSDEELHRWEDATMAALFVALGDPARSARWPNTMGALEGEVAYRVAEARREIFLHGVVSTDTVGDGPVGPMRTSA
jgi:hypothetical protein